MFALLGAFVRAASAMLPNEMVVFFRNALVLVFLMPLFAARRSLPAMSGGKMHLHVLRASAGLVSMYCYFYALAHMKLAEAVLLSYTSPLFIPIIAFLWLHEPLNRRIRIAVLIGFAGVLLILKPGLSIFQPVALVALSAALFASLAMVTIRRMSDTERPESIVFFFTLLSTVISAVPLTWAWQVPGREALVILVFLGLAAMAGQLLMTKGYGLAPAAQVGPFVYCSVVFASIIGWVFWGESLDPLSVVGSLLVFLAGITAARAGVRQNTDSGPFRRSSGKYPDAESP
ncbi:MAG: EamA-like transporter family protein [Deltaproteobacteria bacterium ADurb.Bin072]|nr:DMT family transporter [Deltaproteobacteria bacterium]OQC27983.1 MAG: EamA-like transporter family protein [Deltaproteobacteria bacterium ADurb.Bin072]